MYFLHSAPTKHLSFSLALPGCAQQIDNQLDQHLLLNRVRGGDKQCQHHQHLVVEAGRFDQPAYLQIEKEKKGADALVAVAVSIHAPRWGDDIALVPPLHSAEY